MLIVASPSLAGSDMSASRAMTMSPVSEFLRTLSRIAQPVRLTAAPAASTSVRLSAVSCPAGTRIGLVAPVRFGGTDAAIEYVTLAIGPQVRERGVAAG